MRDKRLLEYRLGGITLIYTQQQGITEHVIRLPVLIEPHILLVPNNPQFINNTGIFLEDFKNEGELVKNNFIIGFKDQALKLVLDIPHAKDVESKDTVFLQSLF